MRLSEFIRTGPDAIECEWEKFTRTLTPFAPTSNFSISSYDLRGILRAIGDDMESPQTSAQQREKSQGKAAYEDALDRITGEHASLRLDSGFNLEHVVPEYRALRATQNTIGNGLGLNAASRKQLASAAKQVDMVAELAALNAKAASEPATDAGNATDRTSVAS